MAHKAQSRSWLAAEIGGRFEPRAVRPERIPVRPLPAVRLVQPPVQPVGAVQPKMRAVGLVVFLVTGPTGVERAVRPVLRAAPRTVGRKNEFLRFPLIPPIEMHKNHKGSRSAHMQHIYWITISKTHQDFHLFGRQFWAQPAKPVGPLAQRRSDRSPRTPDGPPSSS